MQNLDSNLQQMIARAKTAPVTEAEMRLALNCLDLTSLNDNDGHETIDALCNQADQGQYGKVAALCVYSPFVAQAAKTMKGKDINIATVVNFPSGQGSGASIAWDTQEAIGDGATEIDIVFNHKAFLNGYENVDFPLHACYEVCQGRAEMKVILESAVFKDAAQLRDACLIALASGAAFLKTSTGKHTAGGASLEAAAVMLQTIKDNDSNSGIKISGGVRTAEDAMPYLALAREMMGPKWVRPENFRIGASSLLKDLVTKLGFKTPEKAPSTDFSPSAY